MCIRDSNWSIQIRWKETRRPDADPVEKRQMTVTDTLALSSTSSASGGATEAAADRKSLKYAQLAYSHGNFWTIEHGRILVPERTWKAHFTEVRLFLWERIFSSGCQWRYNALMQSLSKAHLPCAYPLKMTLVTFSRFSKFAYIDANSSVSYTHLTLPTIYSV